MHLSVAIGGRKNDDCYIINTLLFQWKYTLSSSGNIPLIFSESFIYKVVGVEMQPAIVIYISKKSGILRRKIYIYVPRGVRRETRYGKNQNLI